MTTSAVTQGSTNLVGFMANQLVNPQTPNQAELVPVLQNTNEQFLQSSGQLQSNAGTQVSPISVAATPAVTAATASTTAPLNYLSNAATSYQAATIEGATTTAPQMQVNELSTIQGQLANLYAQMDAEGIPKWAQASVKTANEVLAARGLKPNSSIGYAAIQGAVQEQALNIAAGDAATYFKADLANFDAQVNTTLQGLQNKQQALLSNQSAENASRNFNAQSQQQTQQFMANLVASINDANASRIQAAEVSNADRKQATNQFYSGVEFQRQQFNATNQFAIDQSNVVWRRSLNTANTAAVNAANQFNVQNKFNLSATAMNNLWQQFRDEASWAFEAAQNDKNRNYNLALVSQNQSFIRDVSEPEWYEALGGFAASLLFK